MAREEETEAVSSPTDTRSISPITDTDTLRYPTFWPWSDRFFVLSGFVLFYGQQQAPSDDAGFEKWSEKAHVSSALPYHDL